MKILKIKDILDVDLSDLKGLTNDKIQPMLEYGKKVLMRRYNTQIQKTGRVAPYFYQYDPHDIRTDDLTHNQMINELKGIQQSLEAKTTTLKGFRHWQKEMAKVTETDKPLTVEQELNLWRIRDKIIELNPALENLLTSDKLISKISEYIETHKTSGLYRVGKYLQKWALEQDENLAYYAQNEWQNVETVKRKPKA